MTLININLNNDRKVVTGLAMLTVMIFIILNRSFNFILFEILSYISCFLVLLLSWKNVKFREAYLLSICFLLTIYSIYILNLPLEVFRSAISQATFLMGFLLFLALLNEAALNSNSVKKCGSYLTNQPANKRYFSIFIGTNLMAILFNLGVISLLSPLIKKDVKGNEEKIEVIEKRQVISMLRGFSWCAVWSPTAIAPIVLIELINGVDRLKWSIYGLLITIIICFVGWIEEKLQTRSISQFNSNTFIQEKFPIKDFLKFFSILMFLFGLTIFFTFISNDTIVYGLVISCPIVMVLWIVFQNLHSKQSFSLILENFSNIFFCSLPKNSSIIIALCCSGYIGIITSKMISIDYISGIFNFFLIPKYVFLIFISVIMIPFSLLGVSPIMMAVFFGSILGGIPILPVDPTLVALAVSAGWALSMTSSPFATVVLLISKLNNYSTIKLTLIWNWLFSLLAIFVLCVIFFFLTDGK